MDFRERIRNRFYADERRPTSDRLGPARGRREFGGHMNDLKRGRPTGRERRLEGRLGRRETFDGMKDSLDYDLLPPGRDRDRDLEMPYVLRIGNLEESVRDTTMEETLYHIFKKFGRIQVRVAGYGKSRHAFVNFESHDAAHDAHTRCQDMFVFDKPLRIEWCTKSSRDQDISYRRSPLYVDDDFDAPNPSSINRYIRNRRLSPPPFAGARSGSPQVSPSRTLLIGNLDPEVSASELRRVFSRFGNLIDLDIKLNRYTKCAYAQVKYSMDRDAIFARESMNHKHVGGSRLYITFNKGIPTTKLVVRGIANRGDAQELKREFSRYGPLRRVEYLDNTTYCFLTFESLDSCYAAIVDWRGRKLRSGGNNLRVDFSRSGVADDKRRRPGRDARGIYEGDVIIQSKPRRKSSTGTRRARSVERNSPVQDYSSKSTYRKRTHRSTDDESLKHNKYRRRSRDQFEEERDRSRQNSANRDLDAELDDNYDFEDAASSWDEHRSQRSYSRYSLDGPPPDNEDDGDSLRERRNSELGAGDLDALGDEIAEPLEQDGPSIEKFAAKYSTVWFGAFMLKNTAFPTQMHLIDGEEKVVDELMKGPESNHLLRVTQRLRLESSRLEEVNKRLTDAGSDSHALLLALPNPEGQELSVAPADSSYRPIRSLVNYLKQKDAAGIVALSGTPPEEQEDNISKEEGETGANSPAVETDTTGVLHAFPPCSFSHELLQHSVPDLGEEQFREDHLVVLVVKGSV